MTPVTGRKPSQRLCWSQNKEPTDPYDLAPQKLHQYSQPCPPAGEGAGRSHRDEASCPPNLASEPCPKDLSEVHVYRQEHVLGDEVGFPRVGSSGSCTACRRSAPRRRGSCGWVGYHVVTISSEEVTRSQPIGHGGHDSIREQDVDVGGHHEFATGSPDTDVLGDHLK